MSNVENLAVNRYAELFKTIKPDVKMIRKRVLIKVLDDIFLHIPVNALAQHDQTKSCVKTHWRDNNSNYPSGIVTIYTEGKTRDIITIKLFTTVNNGTKGNLALTWKLTNANLGQVYLTRSVTAESYMDANKQQGLVHQWFDRLWYSPDGIANAMRHVENVIEVKRDACYYELVGKANGESLEYRSDRLCDILLSRHGKMDEGWVNKVDGLALDYHHYLPINPDCELEIEASKDVVSFITEAYQSTERMEQALLSEKDPEQLLGLISAIRQIRLAPFESTDKVKEYVKA